MRLESVQSLLINWTASWQVSNLTQQLAKGKPHSAKSRQPPLHDSQAATGPPATADDIGHLHAQVEGVESTMANLRALASEQEQQLLQQQLQLQELQLQQQQSQQQQQQQQQQPPPEQCHAAALKLLKQQLKHANLERKQVAEQLEKQKEQSMQLKRDVHQRSLQLEREKQLAASAQTEATSRQTAHARLAQQLEEARAEMNRQHSKVGTNPAIYLIL